MASNNGRPLSLWQPCAYNLTEPIEESLSVRIPKPAALMWFGVCATCTAAAAGAQSVQPTEFQVTGEFQTGRLSEVSGVAVSRTQPGVVWIHNDSGDRARVYATNLAGTLLGSFRVVDAQARDWEDIALGPCLGKHRDSHCIYIADTGDNNGTRQNGIIYIVPEPRAQAEPTDEEMSTEPAHAITVRYPDGPHDIEALAVTLDGNILLVTKGTRGPILLFSISLNEPDTGLAYATLVDTLPIRPARRFGNLVTAAAVSPSGGFLVVRTYTELYFFRRDAEDGWTAIGSPCWIGLRQPQGEAVDFLNETSVVLASEAAMGRRGGLARAVCPIDVGVRRTPENDRITPVSVTPLAETRSRR